MYRKPSKVRDFIVRECKCFPMLRLGTRFGYTESPGLVLDGFLSSGMILEQKGRRYRIYNQALFPLDDNGDLVSDTPTFRPVINENRHLVWEVNRNE